MQDNKKWYEMSLNEKIRLIIDAWEELKIKHLQIDFIFENSEISNDMPVDRDGYIIVIVFYLKENIREASKISFRSLNYNNRGYAKHVVRTLAHVVAKRYFGLQE